MHFLDAWLALSPLDLARLALPVAFLVLSVFLPGRFAARVAAVGLAASVPFLRELSTPPAVTAGWSLLWLAIARQAGRPSGPRPPGTALGGLESGTVGLLLAPALLVLLVACVARLDLGAEPTRRASWGALLLCLGLLHLMLRRHVVRAATGFAGMGLGLQALAGALQATVPPVGAPPAGTPLLAAALAVALTVRVGGAREAARGSAWVSDAHDLHD